jgi:predicted CXXCH cytochrome family protein
MPKRGQKLRSRLAVCLTLAATLCLSSLARAAAAQQSPTAQPGQNAATAFVGAEKCASCHKEAADALANSPHAKADSARGSRSVSCEDCHGAGKVHSESGDPSKISNPGKFSPDARNALCSNCHAEEAGPFTHEHPVVKIESCLACHAAHGSQNAHMLTVSDVNTLCQQCHSMAASAVSSDSPIHNQAAPSKPCTSCHVDVHGSNSSNVFFK